MSENFPIVTGLSQREKERHVRIGSVREDDREQDTPQEEPHMRGAERILILRRKSGGKRPIRKRTHAGKKNTVPFIRYDARRVHC